MTQEQTKSRPRIIMYEAVQVVQKQASSGLSRSLLENELRVLDRLSELNEAPSLLASNIDGAVLTFYREFIQGCPLTDTPLPLWPDLLAKLEVWIQKVHALDLIHGDLKPSNLIITGADIRAIDWEHALPIGAQIADLPFRAVSLGTSHPSLIWGRGTVSRDIDRYSIDSMYEMATARS